MSISSLYFINQNIATGPVGTVQYILPAPLISFKGTLGNEVTTISREVRNEVNSSHYVPERKAATSISVTVRVVNMAGKLVAQQQNNVNEGVNSAPVNNPGRLEPGIYIIQLINEAERPAIPFTVAR